MRRQDVRAVPIEEELVDRSKLRPFVTPRYDGLSLANLPVSVLKHFGVRTPGLRPLRDDLVENQLEGSDRVIVFLVDGLGYDLVVRESSRNPKSLFRRFANAGTLFPATSTFPSTTTTAITTVNTGLTPQQHGIIGYTMYLREMGVVANMISFSPAPDPRRDVLTIMGLDPRSLLPTDTIHEVLAKNGVRSQVLTRRIYKNTALSRLAHAGATITTYVNSSDLFVALRRQIEDESTSPLYVFAYWDALDSIAHLYGPEAEEVTAELASLCYSLKTELLDKLGRRSARKTTLIITGDHGFASTPEEKIILASNYRHFMDYLQLPPTGDSRASIIHVKAGRLDEARAYLSSKFAGRLTVIDSEAALQAGLFGYGRIHKELRSRIGDLIILPHDDHSFVYPYRRREEGFGLKGSHGGLSRGEMLIPILASRMGPMV